MVPSAALIGIFQRKNMKIDDVEGGVVILPRLGQAMAILGNSNIGNVAGNVFSIGNISNFVF